MSLGAGLIVTRSSSRGELGGEVASQIFAKPQALMIAAAFLVAMSVTGLPAMPLLIMGGACTGLALIVKRSAAAKVVAARQVEADKEAAIAKEPEKVEKLLDVDTMALELGYGLVKLVDPQTRRQSHRTHQFPATSPGDGTGDHRPADPYPRRHQPRRERLRHQDSRPDGLPTASPIQNSSWQWTRARPPRPVEGGEQTVEPAFGLPAYWITDSQKGEAELMNYTVVEASAVLATHLTEVVRKHAYELLSRPEVKNLLDNLKQKSPAVVEEVVPTLVKTRRGAEGSAESSPRARPRAGPGNDPGNAR